jgi:hypothetical protein
VAESQRTHETQTPCRFPSLPSLSPQHTDHLSFNTSLTTTNPISTLHNTVTMSAIQDAGDAEPVQVLVTLHDQMNLMDVAGPLEVMSKSLHNFSDPGRHQ